MKFIVVLAFLCLFLKVPSAGATTQDFQTWLQGIRQQALEEGISQTTISATLSNIQPIQKVIDLDRKQPEKKKTFAQYKQTVVSAARIQEGRELMQAYAGELNAIGKKYGVPPQYIVALWGIETNFGGNTGGFSVIPALATLAWEGRRAEFFRKELIGALRIIDEGHIPAKSMKGSWAGAMGQNQFMPSSFHAYAVDENGDGHKDIWGTEIDVFASTANYLKQSGWIAEQKWGRAIKLPTGFPESLVGREIKKPLSIWNQKGITSKDGSPLPSDNIMASIIAPDGVTGEAFLVYSNYDVIMDWNRSTYFATSVGLLADAIAR